MNMAIKLMILTHPAQKDPELSRACRALPSLGKRGAGGELSRTAFTHNRFDISKKKGACMAPFFNFALCKYYCLLFDCLTLHFRAARF